MDERQLQATRKELADDALEHYRRLSMATSDWSSTVEVAISEWGAQAPRTLPAELRAAVERHFFQPASESYAGDSCGACGDDWPCTVALLLAWVDGRDV